ncbi:hypothetical protein [Streptomyces sp. R41]|uniref:Uncharacterized protein n=1 Tax=Streptomyces sp. R41 TaxID=3238632 RepID=A0AB39REB9_9ACTN
MTSGRIRPANGAPAEADRGVSVADGSADAVVAPVDAVRSVILADGFADAVFALLVPRAVLALRDGDGGSLPDSLIRHRPT